MQEFEKKIYNTIKENNLLTENDTVVMGVSGGVDSTVLLYILNKFSDSMLLPLNIKVAHINHGIRNETAKRDAEFVKNMCEDMNIEFYLLEENVPKYAEEHKMTEEEAGREVRYNFFESICSDPNKKIVTAHHMNDNVETILMHFVKGTGLNGLTGMKTKRDNIVRPMLYVTKQEIIQYAQENEITYIEDETNFLNDYTRNKIRNLLIPFIEKELNTSFIASANKTISHLNETNNFVQDVVDKEIKRVCTIGDDFIKYDVKKFNLLNEAIKMEIIMKTINIFTNYERTLRSWFFEEVKNIFNCKDGAIFKAKGLSFYKKNNVVVLNKVITNNNKYIIGEEKEFTFDGKKYIVETKNFVPSQVELTECYIPNTLLKNNDQLVLRYAQDKDIVVFNDDNDLKINKYFSMKGISPEKRTQTLVLAVGNNVYWVDGLMTNKCKNAAEEFIVVSRQVNN